MITTILKVSESQHVANNELCRECYQTVLIVPATTPGLPLPCLGPRTPFTPQGEQTCQPSHGPHRDAWAGAVLVLLAAHALARAVGQTLAVGSTLAIPRKPLLLPTSQPQAASSLLLHHDTNHKKQFK